MMLAATFWSCEKQSNNTNDKPVVEAYLYSGQPVDDIRVTKLLQFGGTDTIPQPINDLAISILWNGTIYPLVNTNDSGYYHYPGNDLLIKANEVYQLQFQYNDQLISATTICPPPPQNLSLTKDTFKLALFSLVDSFLTGGNLEPPPPDSVIASWNNPTNDYFYIVAENIEPNKEPILPPELQGLSSFFFQSEPTTQSEYTFFDIDFRHFGRHQIQVYRVNQEYVDLFQSFEQDSRTQAEPNTNVINGLGVFTAVNQSTLPLYVTVE